MHHVAGQVVGAEERVCGGTTPYSRDQNLIRWSINGEPPSPSKWYDRLCAVHSPAYANFKWEMRYLIRHVATQAGGASDNTPPAVKQDMSNHINYRISEWL